VFIEQRLKAVVLGVSSCFLLARENSKKYYRLRGKMVSCDPWIAQLALLGVLVGTRKE
jgi:hypothetical protein